MPTMVEISKRSTERRMLALSLRREGMTFKEIGQRLGGITAETARTLVNSGLRIEAMRNRFSYDLKCLELARYFYPNEQDSELMRLAQEFQDTAEAYRSSQTTESKP